MKISSVKLYRYSLPLTGSLKLKDHSIDRRDGFVVELASGSGEKSFGEVAPLPGFSREDTDTVENELSQVKAFLPGRELPDGLEKLDGSFEKLFGSLKLSPSVLFGVETAILNLTARSKELSPAQLLGTLSVTSVRINALLAGTGQEIHAKVRASLDAGFTSFKVKLSGLSVDDAVRLVKTVREEIGDAELRADANRHFVLGDAIELMRAIEPFNIAYVEEPAKNLNQLRILLREPNAGANVALDESLLEIRPEDLSLPFDIKAIVTKPTLLGFEKAYRFATEAKKHGIMPVISSSFETSLGVGTLASLAAVVGGDEVAAGLDTFCWLKEDIVDNPLTINNGRISLLDCDFTSVTLDMSKLEEIVGD